MRPTRNRHHFHTFALDDTEEEILRKAKAFTGQGLTNTLMTALNDYVQNMITHSKEKEASKSIFDQVRELLGINELPR